MIGVLRTTWPLFLGLMFLMLGNGLQGTLLGIRGAEEGFTTGQMSVVMSAYFVGFLFASRMAPAMIRRVGHVRVFAALGSFISAALILFPTLTDPIAWTLLRVVIGFCFCGVYITVESWLNDASSNETRGRAMSLYLIVQMVGIIAAQALLNLPDPSGFLLFIIPSVLVSIAFAPILLTANPAPVFADAKRMRLAEIYRTSPLGCVSVFLLGGIFSALFGMASVFGTEAGLTVGEISIFVAIIYTGGLLCQYPIGWASDRMDRRTLILGLSAFGAVASLAVLPFVGQFGALLVVGFVIGGVANPLYSLAIAYTNDYLAPEDMASASAGLLLLNGIGAIGGPLLVGWLMAATGPGGFFAFMGGLLALMAAYSAWRMTRRPAGAKTGAFVAVVPSVSPATVAAAAIEASVRDRAEPGDEAVAKG
ncbi:MFS transporter [Roseicyclus persicicus]|uniref:MFS transporter n=1 Tax=Roseicyclus persicicus TaxID=2650661 RepID=A0A7X6H2Z1_9RHOB|nr:MFS transporter [Roseibacterium persicicum]NKX46399.1 MFS transporter [Roseibacterium persicicum]